MTMKEAVLIKPRRSVDIFFPDIVMEEQHEDELTVTDHPVEVNASITDHAYKLPAKLMLTYVWSGGSTQNTTQDTTFLNQRYQQLLSLQANRTLFDVFTGKRVYHNMLLQSLQVTTDKTTENILEIRLGCREVLLATTQTVTLTPAAVQSLPQKTSPTQQQGSVGLIDALTFNPKQGGGLGQ